MQNARLTIMARDFPTFTKAIENFNKRTKAANARLKKARYETVSRIPVNHSGIYVTVEVRIKDRAKVLWQELSDILDRFQGNAVRASDAIKARAQALAGRPKNQTMAQAAARTKVQPRPDLTASAIAASQSMPAKAGFRPIQPISLRWGVWVPCENEEAAKALSGLLAAIGKAGSPYPIQILTEQG